MSDWAAVGDPPTPEPPALEPVTRLALIQYAGASGDFNPIHTIDEAAEAAGLPSVIAHGMLTMAHVARLFSPLLDRGFVRDYDMRFAGMVQVGDELTVTATYVREEVDEQGPCFTYSVAATNQRGQVVASGNATFLQYSA